MLEKKVKFIASFILGGGDYAKMKVFESGGGGSFKNLSKILLVHAELCNMITFLFYHHRVKVMVANPRNSIGIDKSLKHDGERLRDINRVALHELLCMLNVIIDESKKQTGVAAVKNKKAKKGKGKGKDAPGLNHKNDYIKVVIGRLVMIHRRISAKGLKYTGGGDQTPTPSSAFSKYQNMND